MSPKEMDVRRLRRLLRETARIAEHASLTGTLEKGSRLAIRQYNAIRDHLENIEEVPADLFPSLDEDEDGFDELGVAARLLDNYLDDEVDAEGPPPKGKTKHLEFRFGTGGFTDGGDLSNLRNIGEIIRSHLPEVLREHMAAPAPPSAPAPPAPPAAAAPPVQPVAPVPPAPLPDLEAERQASTPEKPDLSLLLDRLSKPDLTPDERAALINAVMHAAEKA
jgi:hypothetical protein